MDEMRSLMSMNRGEIQAVISISGELQKSVQPGNAQFPRLWDYADDVDTMHFLNSLNNNTNEYQKMF